MSGGQIAVQLLGPGQGLGQARDVQLLGPGQGLGQGLGEARELHLAPARDLKELQPSSLFLPGRARHSPWQCKLEKALVDCTVQERMRGRRGAW